MTFTSCPNIEKVMIEDGVQLQAFNIFEECGIHFIEIGDNVTVTSDRIFYNCKDIEEITIGDNFTSASRWIEGGSIKKSNFGSKCHISR